MAISAKFSRHVFCLIIFYLFLITASFAQLNGSYTINANQSTSGTNFQSFTDLTSALNSQGVSGPVLVNVVPGSGPYTGKVVFSSYTGVNANNRITINGKGETLSTSFASNSSDQRTIGFEVGAKYITIDSLYITSNIGLGIGIKDNCHHIRITNCSIRMTNTSGNFKAAAIAITGCNSYRIGCTTSSNAYNIGVLNNRIFGGTGSGSFHGIYMNNNDNVSRPTKNLIINNTIEDFVGCGIFARNQDDLLIRNNVINRNKRRLASNGAIGIYYESTQASYKVNIERNAIYNLNAGELFSNTNSTIGLKFKSPGLSNLRNRIENNIIYGFGKNKATVFGFQIESSSNLDVVHNSIIIHDPNASIAANSIGIQFLGSNSDLQMLNNIIEVNRKNSNISCGLRFQSPITSSIIDYNNVFVHSELSTNSYGIIGQTTYSSLVDWQAVFGTNSKSVNPFFQSPIDLKPRSEVLNNSGFNFGTINDYYGVPRDTTPDIGAIEFNCGIPSISLAAINDTSIQITLSQLGDSNRVWEVEYDTLNFTPGSGNNRKFIGIVDTLGPLKLDKQYSLYIRSVCQGNNVGEWSEVFEFTNAGIPLAGNYTVNSNQATGGKNFQSFVDLTNRLRVSGVSDSVNVQVVPGSGPYVQQVIFSSISGLSVNAPLHIFGNGETISYNPASSDHRIVGIDSVSYLTLDSLRIKNLNPNIGFSIHLKNQSEYVSIINCFIDNSLVTNPYSVSSGIASGNSNTFLSQGTVSAASNIRIENNQFTGGSNGGVYSAISLHGGTGSYGNIIANNSITDFAENGINVFNQTDLIISNNQLFDNFSSTVDLAGIRVGGNNSKNILIEKNTISNLSRNNAVFTTEVWGIALSSTTATAAEPITIQNNIIRNITYNRVHAGIMLKGNGKFNIYHNTLFLVDNIQSQGTLAGIYFDGTINADIYNNIFWLRKIGSGTTFHYYFNGDLGNVQLDFNVFHHVPSGSANNYFCRKLPFGTPITYNTYADWLTAYSSAYDQNSHVVNPNFNNSIDLKPANPILRSGARFLGLTNDYYDNSRDRYPDIGAIELDSLNLSLYPLASITSTSSGIADSNLVNCTTTGIVSSVNFDGNGGLDFFAIDPNNGQQAGINVKASQRVSNYMVRLNDSIRFSGQVIQSNGQITFNPIDIQLLSDSSQPIVPIPVNQLTESVESKLVQLKNLKLITGSGSGDYVFQTHNKLGDTLSIAIDSDTDINDSLNIASLGIGDSICVITGIVSQLDYTAPYLDHYRLLPSFFEDIDTVTCVKTPFDIAAKDTIWLDLSNCAQESVFQHAVNNQSSVDLVWRSFSVNDTISASFDQDFDLFWNESRSVKIDSSCGSINGTNALVFKGKAGMRQLVSFPLNLSCHTQIEFDVLKASNCNPNAYNTTHNLLIQYSTNDGVTWYNLKSISNSGNQSINLPSAAYDSLINIRLIQLNSSDSLSQVWVVDNFRIIPDPSCNFQVELLNASGQVATGQTLGFGGIASTSSKDSGTVFTTIPIYVEDSTRRVKYLNLGFNYNKNICVEFDFQQLACGGSHQFNNLSTGTNLSYTWFFGDGDTSTQVSPNHQFKKAGNYQVKLLACDSVNCDSIGAELIVSKIFGPKEPGCRKVYYNRNASIMVDFVKIGPDTIYPSGNFWNRASESRDYTCESQTLLNVGSTYLIYCPGSSQTSATKFRYHAWIDYNNDGFMELSERIMFTNNGTYGQSNFTIPTNAVKDIPLRLKMWVFGTNSSNPNYYLIDCTSNPPNGSQVIMRDFTVILTDSAQKPAADFSIEKINCGYQVRFTDSSSFHPSAYHWDFGDGNSAVGVANLTHTYQQPGTYSVTLIVENKLGADTSVKIIQILPQQNPILSGKYLTNCPITFSVPDSSKYTSLNWNYGNGYMASGGSTHNAYTSGGTYEILLSKVDTNGCITQFLDSLHIVDLRDTIYACDSIVWLDGNTYSESNSTAQYVFATDPLGCDSILTLNLTIEKTSINYDTIVSCDSYLWAFNGISYLQTGNYIDTINSFGGCDSIAYLNLTLLNSSRNIDAVISCSPYFWLQTGLTYQYTGIYIDTLTSSIGCDSLKVLNLTINRSISIDTLTVFDNYYWPQTNSNYNQSGFYTDTLTNQYGCDSILAIKLKVNSSAAARIEINLLSDTTRLNVCNMPESVSFYIVNRGSTDTLSWSMKESNKGLYYDNFEHGFKESLWSFPNLPGYVDSCGVLFDNYSYRLGSSGLYTRKINLGNADSIFFSYQNNSNCDTLTYGDLLNISFSNGPVSVPTILFNPISSNDSIIDVAVEIPQQARGLDFIINLSRGFPANYPIYNDITVDNFRIGGSSGSLLNPYEIIQTAGLLAPNDSQLVELFIDPLALKLGWQNFDLMVYSTDSLQPETVIKQAIYLDGVPCADFSVATDPCDSKLLFTEESDGGAVSFKYDFGNGDTSVLANPSYSYSIPGVYNVSLMVCNSFGCDTIQKTINSNLLARITEPVCTLQTYNNHADYGINTVSLREISTTSGYTYYSDLTCHTAYLSPGRQDSLYVKTKHNWSVWAWLDYNDNGQFESSELIMNSSGKLHHNSTFIPASNAVHNKRLRLRIGAEQTYPGLTLNGCNVLGSATEYEDYSVVIIDSTLAPTSMFSSSLIGNCSDSVQFNDLSFGQPTNWFWDFGDGGSSMNQYPIKQYASPGNYTVQLKVQNQYGVDSMTRIVNIPTNVVGPNSIFACQSLQSPSGKFLWTQSGLYKDTLTNQFGCDSIVLFDLMIDTLNKQVSNNSNVLSADANGVNYHWLDCANGYARIPGARSKSFIPVQSGNYAVELKTFDCTDTSQCIQVINVSLPTIELKQTYFSIAPNPNRGVFTIYREESTVESELLSIRNEMGQIVYSKYIRSDNLKIEINGMSEGIYFVQYKTQNEKVIIIK